MNAAVVGLIAQLGSRRQSARMSASSPLQLPREDKLDVLRYLDEFHYWHSLDDERICNRCGHTITGRQILVIEFQGTRGKLRLQCPSAGCGSTPGDWVYANPLQAARLRAESAASFTEANRQPVAHLRTHHGGPVAKQRVSATLKRRSTPSFRCALARLFLFRPIATALHSFRPIA